MRIKIDIVLDWLLVVIFCTFIFLTRDILPAIWKGFDFFLRDGMKYIPAIFIGSSMFFLLLFVAVIKKKKNFSSYAWFLIVLSVLYTAYREIENPYDKMHLFEYFLLSLFAFRLFHHYIFTYKLYFINAIFTIVVAFMDETSQLFTVQRSFSLADLGADFTAAVLGQISIALIVAPRLQVWRFKLKHTYKHFFDHEKWLRGR